jgi:transposase
LSTKIHALVDALGNPLSFFLTPGKAHDLKGADALLPRMQAHTLLADKAFDADERVIDPLHAAGKTAVIPPRSNRKNQRADDKAAFKARHLIENFFCTSNNSAPSRHATTKPPEISSPQFIGNRRHLPELRTGPSESSLAKKLSRAFSSEVDTGSRVERLAIRKLTLCRN